MSLVKSTIFLFAAYSKACILVGRLSVQFVDQMGASKIFTFHYLFVIVIFHISRKKFIATFFLRSSLTQIDKIYIRLNIQPFIVGF